MPTTPHTGENCRSKEVCGRTFVMKHNPPIMEPLCHQLLRQKERWEAVPCPGLLTAKQMDKEKPECLPSHPFCG